MKTLILPLFILFFMSSPSENHPLNPCPKSPNCVCTCDPDPKKTMEPLSHSSTVEEAKSAMKKMVASISGTQLLEEQDFYLHFVFTTSLGGFEDDVEFYFEEGGEIIHFRSASRKGYGDLGANKRRMKKITKAWNKLNK